MGKIFDALQKATPKPITDRILESRAVDHDEAPASIEHSDAATPLSEEKPPQPPKEEAPSPSSAPTADRPDTPPQRQVPGKSAGLLPLSQLDSSLVVVHAPHSYEAEQFRMLRTNLLFPKDGRVPPRTLLVTSALPGEGKSFVSANLASIIAQNVDNHVLLMDADMRHPTIHDLFGLDHAGGLSDYLNGGRPIPELLRRSHTPRLTLLPGGPPPPNPAELLSSRRMAALLQEVKNRYDDRYIIIDSPPPHLTSESNALAKFVDGIIVVVKVSTTPRELVTDLIAKFEEKKLIGIVANWMDSGTQPYYGSDKYTKHYKRGKGGDV